jgi:hypothetical protein
MCGGTPLRTRYLSLIQDRPCGPLKLELVRSRQLDAVRRSTYRIQQTSQDYEGVPSPGEQIKKSLIR